MQVPSINVWTIPIGTAAALALVGSIAAWQRRQRRLRGERPPNTRNLLRPAGYTLTNRLEDCQEKLLTALVVSAGSGAAAASLLPPLSPLILNSDVRGWIATNGLSHTLFSRELLPGLLSFSLLLISCVCGLLWGLLRCLKIMKDMRFLHLGLRGEQAVAEALLEAAEEGYRSFHDFPADEHWNIDHVVVGPGGVIRDRDKNTKQTNRAPGLERP